MTDTHVRNKREELILPEWVTTDQLKDYYLNEWGEPVRDEQGLYERICLEAFQVGLSWRLILERRDSLRRALEGFNPDVVAGLTEADVPAILQLPGVIRNRAKVWACVVNARATVALRGSGEYSDLVDLVWSFAPESWDPPTATRPRLESTPEATELAKALKKAGFTFVGPTTCYALMEACGLVDNRVRVSL